MSAVVCHKETAMHKKAEEAAEEMEKAKEAGQKYVK